MISWANPGWLWGLLGLTVPLVIHLLNASSGRRVLFPALKFAGASKASRVRSIALREPWLLALRLLLLTLLTCWLAGPTWHLASAPGGSNAVLVSPLALQLLPEAAREQAMALAESGAAAPRQLAPGYPSLDAPALYSRPATDAIEEMSPQWAGATTVLVADHPLDRRWRAEVKSSKVTVTTVQPRAGGISVALSVAPEHAADARFVRAALAALATRGDVRWQEISSAQAGAGQGSVDVWISLGERALEFIPVHRLRLRDASAGSRWSSLEINGERFRVRRNEQELTGDRLLSDEDGNPLLVVGRQGNQPTLQFAGRFEAQFNTLVSSGVFPDLLLQWLSQVKYQPEAVVVAESVTPSLALAVLVLLAWLTERLLAFRSARSRLGIHQREITAT